MQRRFAVIIPLALSAVVLAACTGPQGGGETGSPDEPVTVTFASLSIAQAAPIVLAEQEGIFDDNGIDLQIEFVEAAAVVPGLLSGQYDVGLLNAPAVLAARSNDVPIKSVATASVTTGDPADFPIQIVVPTGSDITSPDDLVGRTVATDTLFQLPDLGMRGALLESGVDPADLEIIEIPFSEMGTALAEGRVDAAVISEPFGTILRSQGLIEDLLSTSVGQPDGSPQSAILSSEQFINENPELVAKFQAAVHEALEYAASHDEEMRATLPTFTQLSPELASQIRFVPPSDADSPEGWQAWAKILFESGVTEEEVDASEAYVPRS